MDFHPLNKQLFGVAKRPVDDVDVLIEINSATGAGSEIGPLVNIAPAAGGLDLSFRPDGVLFLSAILPNNNVAVYTVSLATGEATLVGDTLANGIGNGIGYSPGSTLLFGSGPNLYEVDDSNGTTTSSTSQTCLPTKALRQRLTRRKAPRTFAERERAPGAPWAGVQRARLRSAPEETPRASAAVRAKSPAWS